MADSTADPPPPATPHLLIGELRITAGPEAGRMFAVRDQAVVGRDEEADIVLADPTGEISRRHLRLVQRDGGTVIEDLNSTNGTYVNDQRLSEPRRLQIGDEIRIGARTLEFTAADRALIDPPQLTRLRTPPAADVTRARDVPTPIDVTRARDIPTPIDVTRARPVPTTQPELAPPAPAPTVDQTYAPPGADGQLRILSGPGAGTAAAVFGGRATIGREPECDLQVLDSEVSRRHATVTIRDGAATIEDLRSANGTYVDGDRILAPYRLAPEDRIQIGEATIGVTAPVFADVAPHPIAPQVTGVRDVIASPGRLLTGAAPNRKWWTLAVVSITVFMLLLDVTIVAVALPTISRALHPSFSSLQWIVDAYTLGLTAVLLTAGSFADIFGRKRVLTAGLILFTLSSVACAQAPTATFLDFARGVQGVGGATMFACSLALIVQEFPAGERAVAFGVYGATNGLSVAVGPIVGGLLVQSIGWQAIFYLNVPIAIVCFVILQRKLVNLPGPRTRIDWPGLFLSSAAMFLAVFATIRGNEDGWTSSIILGCYAGALLLGALFLVRERRTEHPMFDIGLFRNPTFIGASVAAFTACFSVLALIFFLTTWLQSVLGYSPVGAGTRLLVFTVASLIVAPIAGRMTGTTSPRLTLSVGLGVIAVGVASMAMVRGSSTWVVIVPGLILAGVGLGTVNPTLGSTAVSVVPPWRGGMASGVNSTAREAGTTAGIAVLGSVLQHRVDVQVPALLAGTAASTHASSVASAISVGQTPELLAKASAALRPTLLHTARVSYAAGLRDVFYLAAAVAAVGCVTALALVRKRHLRADATGVGH